MRVIYKEGDVLNGFRLLSQTHDKSGRWNMLCKACGLPFAGSPKKIGDRNRKSCGCLDGPYWLDLVGLAEVKRLSADGLSSGLIAKAITERLLYYPDWTGASVTKNMVLGVLSRRVGSKKSEYFKPIPRRVERDASDVHTCAFPLGDPGKADFHFCHEPLKEFGAPYCIAHMKVAYMPLPSRVRI